MINEDALRNYIRELIQQELEDEELEEASTTASAGGEYDTPMAFRGKSGKKKAKAGYFGGHKKPDVLGYHIVEDPDLRGRSGLKGKKYLPENFIKLLDESNKVGKYDLFMGQFGNGLTISDKNREVSYGEYKNIAHISAPYNKQEIKYYEKVPSAVKRVIEKAAQSYWKKNESINELYVIQYKNDKNRFLSSKARDVKTTKDASQFKSEKDANDTLNGMDWQFRSNYKIIPLNEEYKEYGIQYKLTKTGGWVRASLTRSTHNDDHKQFIKLITKDANKLKKQEHWLDVRITVNGNPVNESVNEASDYIGHFSKKGKDIYVDSDFLNRSKGVLPNSELKHMGMGEFYLETSDGKVDFARLNIKIKDFVGRTHHMYDNADGKIVKKLLQAMLRSKRAIETKYIKESINERTTAKTIRGWLKSLPENKWRKTYGVDARRISHFVNEGDEETMPQSLRRRGEGVSYDRERTLATKYTKYMEGLRESIRQIIIKEISGEVKELRAFIDASNLKQQIRAPIYKNLTLKKQQGKYNKALAQKAFLYLVNTGAKLYVKEYGGEVNDLFPKKIQQELAHEYVSEFESDTS